MLLVVDSSQGIWVLIWVGDTRIKGERIPSKYTSTPHRSMGNGELGLALQLEVGSSELGAARLVPKMVARVPGAKVPALSPPVKLELSAITLIIALAEVVTATEM